MKDRFEIAADLRQIARLLTIKGENPFKAQAYQRGASALETLGLDFDPLVKAGRLKEIAGIGSALAATIEEIYRTGECWSLRQMREELPAGVVELSEVPGLSLKKIIALNDTLGINSVTDLKTACQEGRVSKVKGFGAKSQAKLLADIEKYESPANGVLLLHHALETAEKGVTVNAICPGYVWTPLVAKQVADQAKAHGISEDDVVRNVMLAPQPTRQFVQPEEIAELAAYLCGDMARSITGSAISIDGGWTAK